MTREIFRPDVGYAAQRHGGGDGNGDRDRHRHRHARHRRGPHADPVGQRDAADEAGGEPGDFGANSQGAGHEAVEKKIAAMGASRRAAVIVMTTPIAPACAPGAGSDPGSGLGVMDVRLGQLAEPERRHPRGRLRLNPRGGGAQDGTPGR